MSDDRQQYNTHGIFQATPKPSGRSRGVFAHLQGGGGLPGFVVPLVLFAVLAGVIWYAYPKSAEDGIVPVIQADPSAYKARPDDPGGRQYAHRDSTVFEPFDGSRAEGAELADDREEPVRRSGFEPSLSLGLQSRETGEAVETLIAREETVPLSELRTRLQNPEKLARIAEDAPQEKTAPVKEDQPQVEASPVAKVTEEDIASVTQVRERGAEELAEMVARLAAPTTETKTKTETETKAETEKTQPAPQSAAVSAGEGGWLVQLGAFGSRESAEGAWGKFRKDYELLLFPLTPDYQQAEVGGKTLYRLRAGYFAGRDDAVKICEALKKQGGNFLVTR